MLLSVYEGGSKSKFPKPIMHEKHSITWLVFSCVIVVVKQVGTNLTSIRSVQCLRRISIVTPGPF